MDRKEFATILSERRKALGYSYVDMIIKTEKDREILANVLLGRKACFMPTVLNVMAALDLQIVATRDIIGAEKIIDSVESMQAWMDYAKATTGTNISRFAEAMGVTRLSLSKMIRGVTRIRIDTFLKWAEVSEFTINLLPSEPS